LIFELINLAFDLKSNNNKSEEQKQYEKIFSGDRKQQNFPSDLPKSRQNSGSFWTPKIVKEFKWKYYRKRDTQQAYKEFRNQPLDQIHSEIKEVRD
jgi:hypothetical protein